MAIGMTDELHRKVNEQRTSMIVSNDKNSGLVYSTEHGRMCPECGKPVEQCVCKQQAVAIKGNGVVTVGRETKGRKGKGVTVITGVPLGLEELQKLATELKQKCGCGGTVKNGVIEIQGEQRDKIIEELKKKGWQVKRSGG
jgi:translation initiation factor 1